MVLYASVRLRRGVDRVHDVLVAGAAAQIAFEALADLFVLGLGLRSRICLEVMIMPGVQKPHCSAVFVPERFLHRIQLAVGRKSFDGEHVRAIGLHREHGAALDRLAVDLHRASAAQRSLAADVRAR